MEDLADVYECDQVINKLKSNLNDNNNNNINNEILIELLKNSFKGYSLIFIVIQLYC